LGEESEAAAHGFNVTAQSREKKVTALFETGDSVLPNVECMSHVLLGQLVRAPKIAERHFFGDELCGAAFDFPALSWTELLH
jgi:hypothetical protein